MRIRLCFLLGDAVGVLEAGAALGLARPAGDAGADRPRGLADAPEPGVRLDLDAVTTIPPGRLAVHVVAEASGVAR